MGWGSPPKPNKQLVAEQQSAAEQAKNDRIQQLQQELQGEDQTRSQFYGALPGGGGSGQSGQSGGGGGGNGGMAAAVADLVTAATAAWAICNERTRYPRKPSPQILG
jgi:hypothetical protein